MQVKTIQKTIQTKLTEWLDTIPDESLRKSVKDNILVSGGSITSLFLGEPVNDYDVYIKDRAVLTKLVEYYIKGVGGIEILNGAEKEKLEKEMMDNYQADSMKEIQNSLAVCIRNLKEDQVKLFFTTGGTKGGKRLNEDVKDEDKKYVPSFFSPNAISLTNQIQIVIRFHGDNEAIHKTFDFIHATNYFTFEDGLVTNKEALECILTKQLRYQGSLYPLTTIIRVKKFLKRGWNVGAGELLKIMFQISELNLKDPDVLEEQLIGVDVAYFGKLIEILRGIDNLEYKMTSQYLNTIVDKVFNEFEGGE